MLLPARCEPALSEVTPGPAPAPQPGAHDDWSGAAGRRWLAQLDRFEAMIAPIGDALLARADVRPGERVIDLGCGGGATTRALAQAVGPDGAVLGLDISPDLIAAAQARSTGGGAQLRFLCADAATASFPGAPYDRIVSRFGGMFFADLTRAFAAHHDAEGGVRLPARAWLVTARR